MANLYTPYNNGTFESSFQAAFILNGSGGPVNSGVFDMSNEYAIQGLTSGRIIISADAITDGLGKYAISSFPFRSRPSQGFFNPIVLNTGTNYEMQMKMITPSGNPIADDDAMVFIGGDVNDFNQPSGVWTDLGGGKYKYSYNTVSFGIIEYIGYKVSAIKDSLQTLSYFWKEPVSNLNLAVPRLIILLKNTPTGAVPIVGTKNLLVGGRMFFDEAFLDVPPPPCSLIFGAPAYTKTDETGINLDDGTITVNATGQGTLQYKLDAGAFQFSNVFTGIPVGNHSVTVKDQSVCANIVTNFTILEFNAPPPPPPPPIGGVLLIDQKPVNGPNFVNWFPADGAISFESIECTNEEWDLPKPYRIINKKYNHYAVVAQAEEFSFYINFDTPLTDPDFTSLRIGLIKGQTLVSMNIGTLVKDLFEDGVKYNLYASITLSASFEEGDYMMVIYNSVSGAVLFTSSGIQIMTPKNAKLYTCRIIHRNTYNIYKYYYARLPEYVNKIRLKLNLIEEQPEATIQQYRASSTGKLRNVSFELDKYIKLESYFFDDLAILGMYVFQMCDTININEKNYILKEVYKTNWNLKLNINKGLIEFYEQEFSTANRFGKPGNLVISGSDDPLLLGDGNGRIKL
jgi:hypothetical protein